MLSGKSKAYNDSKSLYLTDCRCSGPLPVPPPALVDAVRVQKKEKHTTGRIGLQTALLLPSPTSLLLHEDPTALKTRPSHSDSPATTAQETKLADSRATQY